MLNFGHRKLPMTYQAEESECGVACLQMIAAYHGYVVDMNTLRSRMGSSVKGMNLLKLAQLGESVLHLSARSVRVELEEIENLTTPCVLHWKLTHFVVLRHSRRGRYIVHDPDVGIRTYGKTEVSRYFTGIATELTPTKEFEQKRDYRSLRIRDLWTNSRGLVSSIIQIFILALFLQVAALLSPLYMQGVVDEVLSKGDDTLLKALAIGFGLLLVIKIAVSVLRDIVMMFVGNQLAFQMTTILNQHLIRLPLRFFENRHLGDILTRFQSLTPIRDLFSQGVVVIVLDGVMAIATLAMMFYYSVSLAAIVVGALIIYLAIRLASFAPLRQRTEQQLESSAVENSLFMENVRSIQSIKLFGREGEREALWQNALMGSFNDGIRVQKLSIGLSAANGLVFGAENVLVIFLGAKLVQDGIFTIGMLYAFVAYKSNFTDRVTALVNQLIQFKMLRLHLSRVSDIALEPPEDRRLGHVTPKPVAGDLELRDVSFRYAESEDTIIDCISLRVEAGELIVITGPSGAGKSTLLKIMLGLLAPSDGSVLLDNRPYSQYGMSEVRRYFSSVMQNDQILSGSIADNIAMFEEARDPSRVEDAGRAAKFHEEIMAMPMTYDSRIGDMGAALSAGQRQRLLLARALYKNPSILLLDEGTSNLDQSLEHDILNMVETLNMTRIMVSHNPTVMARADRVVVLDRTSTVKEIPIADKDTMGVA